MSRKTIGSVFDHKLSPWYALRGRLPARHILLAATEHEPAQVASTDVRLLAKSLEEAYHHYFLCYQPAILHARNFFHAHHLQCWRIVFSMANMLTLFPVHIFQRQRILLRDRRRLPDRSIQSYGAQHGSSVLSVCARPHHRCLRHGGRRRYARTDRK